MKRALMILMLMVGLLAPTLATASPILDEQLTLEEYDSEHFDGQIAWGQATALIALGASAAIHSKGASYGEVTSFCLLTIAASAVMTAMAYQDAPPGVSGELRSYIFPISALVSLAINLAFVERGVFADSRPIPEFRGHSRTKRKPAPGPDARPAPWRTNPSQ